MGKLKSVIARHSPLMAQATTSQISWWNMAFARGLEKSVFRLEADFTKEYVIPLFLRMGFTQVAYYHGVNEHGKDLVCGDVDRFGNAFYVGIQVKHKASLSPSNVKEMADDVFHAFGNSFKHPHTGKDEEISRFYYVNSGSISEPTRTSFMGQIGKHKPFTVIYDGDALVSLNNLRVAMDKAAIQERITAAVFEVHYNSRTIDFLKNDLGPKANALMVGNYPKSFTRARLRSTAIIGLIQNPFAMNETILPLLDNYAEMVTAMNHLLDAMDCQMHGLDWLSKLFGRASAEIIELKRESGPLLEQLSSSMIEASGGI